MGNYHTLPKCSFRNSKTAAKIITNTALRATLLRQPPEAPGLVVSSGFDSAVAGGVVESPVSDVESSGDFVVTSGSVVVSPPGRLFRQGVGFKIILYYCADVKFGQAIRHCSKRFGSRFIFVSAAVPLISLAERIVTSSPCNTLLDPGRKRTAISITVFYNTGVLIITDYRPAVSLLVCHVCTCAGAIIYFAEGNMICASDNPSGCNISRVPRIGADIAGVKTIGNCRRHIVATLHTHNAAGADICLGLAANITVICAVGYSPAPQGRGDSGCKSILTQSVYLYIAVIYAA